MPNFFDAHSPFLNHPLLTPERSRDEVESLISLLDISAPQRVLDLGCGFGRHAVEFAELGFDTTGIDPSAAMIDAATHLASTRSIAGVTFSTDLANAEGPFDAAVAMFTTIGQVGADQASNEAIINEVAARLSPGAGLLVEVPQREAAVAQLVAHDAFGSGDNSTTINRRFDPATFRVHETFEVVQDGVERSFDLAYRLFDQTELEQLLTSAGFERIEFFADLDGNQLEASSPTMIALARRPA